MGLTKCGLVGMIMTQAVMFVLPAVLMGFILSFPLIYFLYNILFLDSLGYLPTVLPSLSAVLSALFVGMPHGQTIEQMVEACQQSECMAWVLFTVEFSNPRFQIMETRLQIVTSCTLNLA